MKSNALTALETSVVAPAGDELDPEQLALVTGAGDIRGAVIGWLVGKVLDGLVEVAKAAPAQWAKGSPYNELGANN
jgi:hypothetical protein